MRTSKPKQDIWPSGPELAAALDAFGPSSAIIDTAPTPAPTGRRAPQGPLDATRILLAEDDPYQRRILRVLLASPQISMLEVENGQSAIDLLGLRSFDLLMLDTQMPLMDGIETIAWIRSRMTLISDIPILGLIPGEDEDAYRGPMLARGMTAWTQKPVNRSDLVAKIIQLMPGLHAAGL